MPDDLAQALTQNPASKTIWDKLPPSHQREYLKWINEAKKPETRARRIQKTIVELKSK